MPNTAPGVLRGSRLSVLDKVSGPRSGQGDILRPPWRPVSQIRDLKEPIVGPREASEFIFRTPGSLRSPRSLPCLWGEGKVSWQRVGCCFCGSHPKSVLSCSLGTPSPFCFPASSGLLLPSLPAHTCGFSSRPFLHPFSCVSSAVLCAHASWSLFHPSALCVCLPSLLGATWYLSLSVRLTCLGSSPLSGTIRGSARGESPFLVFGPVISHCTQGPHLIYPCVF